MATRFERERAETRMTHPVDMLMYNKENRDYVEKNGKPYDYSKWHTAVGSEHENGPFNTKRKDLKGANS